MKSYNIAVIVAGIDEEYQNCILNGLHKYAKLNNVNLTHFIAFGGILKNPRHDMGEFNIFTLPDFSKFDGAVLLTNTISSPPVTQQIISKIKAAGIYAVSIDYDISEFFHIGIDNRTAMMEMTRHFINHHGFRKIKYISGPYDNPESIDRLDGFKKVMQENNILVNENDIFYGDFRFPSGREAVETFLKQSDELPEVIICANDAMAISAISALNDAGYSVPKDISVSGFDNTYNARNYSPELTSVKRPLEESGSMACKKIIDALNNIPQERRVILDMMPRFTESCACPDTMSDKIEVYKKKNYRFIEYNNRSLSLINRMSCQLIECDSFDEYILNLKSFVKEIDAEEFYLCLCDDWNEQLETSEENGINGFINNKFTSIGYTDNIIVPLAYYNEKFQDYPSFDSNVMLPSLFDETGKNKFYYFIPIHFRERCLGFSVILNSQFPLNSIVFQTWNITLSNTLENIRKIIHLDDAVKKLNKLYTIDTLCGIFNRSGFKKQSDKLYKYCIKRKRPVMLMFIDMDGLKKINDNYGHKEGDKAICALADAIRMSCVNGEVYGRFGGDEFIIFAADYSESEAYNLKKLIESNIELVNKMNGYVFSISASIGSYIAVPELEYDLFQMVTHADNVMYEHKKRKKISKYLKGHTDILP